MTAGQFTKLMVFDPQNNLDLKNPIHIVFRFFFFFGDRSLSVAHTDLSFIKVTRSK